ncbi:MAG: T9SS type A sorting domain-containing protein [Chitinophagales bacterium]
MASENYINLSDGFEAPAGTNLHCYIDENLCGAAKNNKEESNILVSHQVYPNPTDGMLYVTLADKNIAYLIEIFNLDGNLLYNETVGRGVYNSSIDISAVKPNTLLIVKIQDANGNYFYRKILRM